jgi:hypothetical protein
MASGISMLLEDRQYALRLAAEAMKKAEALYSDEAYMKRVADFYAEVFQTNDGSH